MNFDLNKRPKVKVYKPNDIFYSMETKYDGYRLTIIKHSYKDIEAYFRKPETNVIKEIDYLNIFKSNELISMLPNNTVVEGELHLVGGASTDVINYIKNKQFLMFSPFAYPYFDGIDLTDTDWDTYEEVLKGFMINSLHKIKPYRLNANKVDFLKETADSLGIEGYVLKKNPYSCWYKVKPIKSFDAVILGVTPGKGKYANKIGAFIIGSYSDDGYMYEIGKCAGMSDEVRDMHISDVSGRVIEVAYEGLTSKNKPRFPRFLRFRDDKPSIECKLSEIV